MHYAERFLDEIVTVTMDRPMGTRHPKHGFLYPVNYGYVAGTQAPDGGAVDAYVLGVFEPLSEFTGRCIAIIRRKEDDDDKLVVVPESKRYSDEQVRALTEFQERAFSTAIIRNRS